MVNWDTLKDFIKKNYQAKNDDGKSINIEQAFESGRTQLVNVSKHEIDDKVWVHILSRVGTIAADKLNEALELLYKQRIGGLVQVNGKHFVRHCIPIDDLSTEEFDKPMRHVAAVADALEEKYIGTDRN
jgi:hypothetical protein